MSLIVEVKEGKLRGRENKSVLTGQKYYTFSGIPYAKPPIGNLRFKDPQPYGKWEGIYDATYERDSCFQENFLTHKWEGSEDCLYLNINIPENPAVIKSPKAVMVYIHGGGYFCGSGSEKEFSADYLIPRDVILVTMNYRLHVLGFLNLGIPDCTGNAGLKDQSFALKWVKENIIQFGGDPNNITIFGESAGGGSVHFQILSPLSKGLFQKAILESGNAFGPWNKNKVFDPKDMSKDLGERLGFSGEGTQELLEFLKKQELQNLVDAYSQQFKAIEPLYPAGFCLGPFSPNVEAIKDGAFLPESVEELLKKATPLPIIYGVNNKEGYIFVGMAFTEDIVTRLRQDFSIILKSNFDIDPQKVTEVGVQVKKYYLNDKEVGAETAEQLTDLCSDIMFFKLHESIDFVTKSSTPPYLYEFDYDKNQKATPNINLRGLPKNFKGASHGAEIPFLFFAKNPSASIPSDPDDLTVIKNMTTLWTNFAKTGNPSDGQIVWTPSTSNEPCYVEIDTKLELKKGKLYGERLLFLKNVIDSAIIHTQ